MIIRFWCWLWGHKTILKVATGQTYETTNPVSGFPQLGHYLVLERKDFCVRCGKKVHDSSEKAGP